MIEIQHPSDEQLETIHADLAAASSLHLIHPEDGVEDGATNADLLRDQARSLGLSEQASEAEVRQALTDQGHLEVRVITTENTNTFFLTPQAADRLPWLDAYLTRVTATSKGNA